MTTDTVTFPHRFNHVWASDLLPDGSVWLAMTRFFSEEFGELGVRHHQAPHEDDRARVVVNVEVLQAALNQITNNPETWNQAKWFTDLPEEYDSLAAAPECGTAGCLAGTIVLQQGGKLGHVFEEMSGSRRVTVPGTPEYLASSAATDLLMRWVAGRGTWMFTDVLWDASNSLKTLWALGQLFASGRLSVPPAEDIKRAQKISEHLYAR